MALAFSRVSRISADDAELQALVAEAAGDPNFSIRYDGNCDGADTGTDTGADTGTTPGNGDDDDDDNGGVSELPDTGTGAGNGQNGAGLLLVGVGGLLALVGAFALRLRGQA